MSKPVFSDLFVVRGVRRNRQSFLQALVLQAMAWTGLVLGASKLFAGHIPYFSGPGDAFTAFSTAEMLLAAAMGLAAIPLLLIYLAVGTQRCRDCGVTGWAALVLLVPLVNVPMLIALAICPGQDGANKYGENPLRRAEVASRFDAMLEVTPLEERPR